MLRFVNFHVHELDSSADEIAKLNLFTTISHTLFKIPKNRTYSV